MPSAARKERRKRAKQREMNMDQSESLLVSNQADDDDEMKRKNLLLNNAQADDGDEVRRKSLLLNKAQADDEVKCDPKLPWAPPFPIANNVETWEKFYIGEGVDASTQTDKLIGPSQDTKQCNSLLAANDDDFPDQDGPLSESELEFWQSLDLDEARRLADEEYLHILTVLEMEVSDRVNTKSLPELSLNDMD